MWLELGLGATSVAVLARAGGGTPTPSPTTDTIELIPGELSITSSTARPYGQYTDGSYWMLEDAGETFEFSVPSADVAGRWMHGCMKNPGNRSFVTTSSCNFTASTDVVQHNAHGRLNGDMVMFATIVTTTGISVETGYFVINKTTNTFQLATTRDGTAIPLTGDGTGTYFCNYKGISQQGWDSYGSSGGFAYNSAHNIDSGATGSPIPLTEGSYVKILSDTGASPGDQQLPEKMVVFTVVATEPAADAFRPGVSSTSKASLFRASELDLSMLQSIDPAGLSVTPPELADIIAVTTGPYPQHHTQNTGSGQREFMPQNPRPKVGGGFISQQEYGSYIAQDFEKGYNALNLNYTEGQKLPLAKNFVVMSNDYLSRMTEGGLYTPQGAGEGYRRLPMVIAATFLQASPNIAVLEQYIDYQDRFSETGQIFVVDQEDVDRTHTMAVEAPGDEGTNKGSGYVVGDDLTITGGDEILPGLLEVDRINGTGGIEAATGFSGWDVVQQGQWYTGPANPFSITTGTGTGATVKQRLRERFTPGMIGNPEWGESPLTSPADNGANMDSYYRMSNGNHGVGESMFLHLVPEAKAIFNNQTFLDYHDRYFNHYKADTTGGVNQINTLTKALYLAHRWDGEGAATAPTRTGIYVDERFVWVTYNKLLDQTSVPDPSDFTLVVEGNTATLSFEKVRGYMVGYTHDLTVAFGDTGTLAYVAGANPLRSIRESNAAGFSAEAVSNEVPPVGTIVATDMVDNGGVAWSKVAIPSSDTGVNRFLIAVRFRLDTVATSKVLFGGTRSQGFCVMTSGSALRLQLGGTTVFRQDSSALSAGVTYTAIWAVDFTQATAAAQGIMYLGSTRQSDPGTFDSSTTRTVAIATALANGFGIFARPSDGTEVIDGAVEWIYSDWGVSGAGYTLPDITDALVRAEFDSAEFLNTDGEGPTGLQPKLFYAGDLAEWNSVGGVVNKGSISSRPAVSQTGTYT